MSESRRVAEVRMMEELRKFQQELSENWVDRSLPEGWNGLDMSAPLPVVKEKVTLRLDADMVRWFRKLGPGYGTRINTILRIYWQALLAGRVTSHWDENEVAPAFMALLERMGGEEEG
ncbi:BrnA antitoxin family protein [Marimonas arenosa]|uniref:BrnA antitoxin family protein n=1 Tax=Marimonas arenosa TaxID=1795305 RepID=A0AAE3WGM1_9RHOB|nr:BrnA antitoxin family protein [Marimonas arenosa]MDQ2091427.1 BrnA antitoxin family protein [Marimonas arenosa]